MPKKSTNAKYFHWPNRASSTLNLLARLKLLPDTWKLKTIWLFKPLIYLFTYIMFKKKFLVFTELQYSWGSLENLYHRLEQFPICFWYLVLYGVCLFLILLHIFRCLFQLYIFLCVFQALIHGLNRHYYSIAINYRKNEREQKVKPIVIH